MVEYRDFGLEVDAELLGPLAGKRSWLAEQITATFLPVDLNTH